MMTQTGHNHLLALGQDRERKINVEKDKNRGAHKLFIMELVPKSLFS